MLGTRAVAAPLWNYEQRVIGALGVSFPLSTSTRAEVQALGPVVREVTDRLSLHLGARRSTLVPPTARRRRRRLRAVPRASVRGAGPSPRTSASAPAFP